MGRIISEILEQKSYVALPEKKTLSRKKTEEESNSFINKILDKQIYDEEDDSSNFKKDFIERGYFYILEHNKVTEKKYTDLEVAHRDLIARKVFCYTDYLQADYFPVIEFMYLFRQDLLINLIQAVTQDIFSEYSSMLEISNDKRFALIRDNDLHSYLVIKLYSAEKKLYAKHCLKSTTGLNISGNFIAIKLQDPSLKYMDPNRKAIFTSYKADESKTIDDFRLALAQDNFKGFSLQNKFICSHVFGPEAQFKDVKAHIKEQVNRKTSIFHSGLFVLSASAAAVGYFSSSIYVILIFALLAALFGASAVKKSEDCYRSLLSLFMTSVSLLGAIATGYNAIVHYNRFDYKFLLLFLASLTCLCVSGTAAYLSLRNSVQREDVNLPDAPESNLVANGQYIR